MDCSTLLDHGTRGRRLRRHSARGRALDVLDEGNRLEALPPQDRRRVVLLHADEIGEADLGHGEVVTNVHGCEDRGAQQQDAGDTQPEALATGRHRPFLAPRRRHRPTLSRPQVAPMSVEDSCQTQSHKIVRGVVESCVRRALQFPSLTVAHLETAGAEGELAALAGLESDGRGLGVLALPAAVEDSFYRYNNLPARLVRLYRGVDPLDP